MLSCCMCCSVQSDVNGLVEEVTITAAVSFDIPSSPSKPAQANLVQLPGAPPNHKTTGYQTCSVLILCNLDVSISWAPTARHCSIQHGSLSFLANNISGSMFSVAMMCHQLHAACCCANFAVSGAPTVLSEVATCCTAIVSVAGGAH